MTTTKTSGTLRVLSDREFTIEYTFDAPRASVFNAYTDPKLVAQWWGQPGGSFKVDRMDVRPGGSYRFLQTMQGREVAFVGTYREVTPVSRLVYTFATEGQPGSGLLAIVELTETGGKTQLLLRTQCASKEALDGMLQYGAEAGARAAWDRLAIVLRQEVGR